MVQGRYVGLAHKYSALIRHEGVVGEHADSDWGLGEEGFQLLVGEVGVAVVVGPQVTRYRRKALADIRGRWRGGSRVLAFVRELRLLWKTLRSFFDDFGKGLFDAAARAVAHWRALC